MPRRLATPFKSAALADLARQLRFTPAAQQAEQVRRAERLHDEIAPDATYPIDYLAYRITRFRRESDETTLLVGEAVRHDLRLLIDQLSRNAGMPMTEREPVETVDELASRLGVSAKTVNRWRQRGLRWRWFVPIEGRRKRLGFTREAVERFVREHAEDVERAAGFSQLPEADRQRVVERARQIKAERGGSLNRVAGRIAPEFGRALETIRLILERHDRENPDEAIFTDGHGPLTDRDRRLLLRAAARGVSASRIGQRIGRSRATVLRLIHQHRARQLAGLRLDCVRSPTFERDDADEVLLGPATADPDEPTPATVSAVPVDDLPHALRPLYRCPVIEPRRQRSLFVRYNYLKFKAANARQRLDPYHPRVGDLDRIEQWVAHAHRIRDQLIHANLPVVLSIAKRHRVGDSAAARTGLLDLLLVGNAVLFEAVETYDAGSNRTFESYLSNLLMKRFALEERNLETVARAQRRWSDADAVERLLRHAARHGVDLRPAVND